MTDERPFVSDAERRRHEHLSASKPTSADRVSDRLNELTAENNELRAEAATTERYLREQLRKAEAVARKPYADKIMALEAELAKANADKQVLMEQVEHGAALLHTVRTERDAYHDRLSTLRSKVRDAVERSYPA